MAVTAKRALRHRLTLHVVKALVWVSAHLPLRLSHALGGALGALGWHVGGRTRLVTERNLALCLPELDEHARRRLARESFVEMGKTLLEAGALWSWPKERVTALATQVSGRELIDDAIAAGRGVILAAPHLGAWEMVGLYWSTQHRITSLYRPPRLAALDSPIQHGREHLGAQLVPTDASGVRALLQALKRGQIAGILPDQEPPAEGGGVFAPFFGVPAWTMRLLTRLAQRSNAVVVFCYAERLPRGRGFHIHVLPARAHISDDDPLIAATALNLGVEQCARACPAQYQWSYKRFRKRPAGEKSVYRRGGR
ncbi:MAG: hypothetical protein AMJ69_03815 [Gammaproteobacteria bacterium SG8_47]|nr:MAG: hypothetical protein AMJ69_03815 [Gammaproteobacteria bacterium SG8_47]